MSGLLRCAGLLLASLAMSATLQAGGHHLDGDPIPHQGQGRHDLKHPYIVDELPGTTLPPGLPRPGKTRFQMRLMNHKLVNYGPHNEYNWEFELLRTLVHKDPEYRIAAIEELVRYHPTVRVARALIRRLSDHNRKVRERAAYGLGKMRYKGTIRPLIDMLELTRGNVARTIGQSLTQITGLDWGHDYEAWDTWYWRVARRLYSPDFQIPRPGGVGTETAQP